jgi:hypothetical protein
MLACGADCDGRRVDCTRAITTEYVQRLKATLTERAPKTVTTF